MSLSLMQETQNLSSAGKVKLIGIDKLYRADNVRTDETLFIPEMVSSIRRQGYQQNHPLVVSEREDGAYLVLRGNRRAEAIEVIKADDPVIFGQLFPKGTVPCIVHRGLTEAQEAVIRIDHGKDEDRVPLDQWGEFRAIQQLRLHGFSETDIAAKLGLFDKNGKPRRPYVQDRVKLAGLPEFVQEQARLCVKDKTKTPFRWASIKNLASIHAGEKAEYPDNNGPLFTAAWEEIMSGETKAKAKVLTLAEIGKRADACRSKRLCARVMLAVGNQEDSPSIADVDDACKTAEIAESTLASIQDCLGDEEFSSLILRACGEPESATV